MKGKVLAAVALVVSVLGPVRADEASLELTFKPQAKGGEKTVLVARTRDRDGAVRAETRLEVSVTRGADEKTVTVKTTERAPEKTERPARAERKAARARVRLESRDPSDEVAKALAQAGQALDDADRAVKDADRAAKDADGAVKDAEQAVKDAAREVAAARRELRVDLEALGVRLEGERVRGREPRTVCELVGIDEKLVVRGSAARKDVTVEVTGRKVACSLHTFDVKDGSGTRSVSVWVSPETKGSGLVALRVAARSGTHEVAVEGFVAGGSK